MSVKLMSLVFDIPDTFMNSTQKFVLLALADNAHDEGDSCYPSRGRIEHKTSLKHTAVGEALRFLSDNGWAHKTGRTDYGVVEWRINVGKLYDCAVPYEPENPYSTPGDGATPPDGDPPTAKRHTPYRETVTNHKLTTNEPSYIDDVGGVPDELEMEWDTFVLGWQYYFPDKVQPRKGNATLKKKFKTRMKSTTWRNNWKNAIKTASKWQWAHNEGWFKADWIVHNEDNIFKLLDGTFDFKLKDYSVNSLLTSEPSADKINPNARINLRQRPDESDEDYQRRING